MPTLVDRGPDGSLSHLYVHIPYCRDRCTYCAFATTFDRPAEHGALVGALASELVRQPLDGPLRTLYFGGGTPSLLSAAHLGRLLEAISSEVALDGGAEITLEANPLDVTSTALTRWHELGITRLSLGVQTFVRTTLRNLGRHHDGDQARAALETVANGWPGSWSADLLVGWSGQSEAQVAADTEELLRFAPPHVSVYGLTLEPGTPLLALQRLGRTVTADPELALRFDEIWSGLLAAAGLERYEVSNFARPGHVSRHNASYWRNDAYLGLGPGASSSVGELRWSNIPATAHYLQAARAGRSLRQRVERLDPSARLLECLAVGLRTRAGLKLAALDRRFSPAWRDATLDAVRPLEELGLIELTENRLRIDSNAVVLTDIIVSSLASAFG